MPSNTLQNEFCTENYCSFHHIAYAHHFTHHLLLTLTNSGVHSSVIADTGKYREKIDCFGRVYSEVYLKVFQLSYFASECLFQQAFYLKITLSVAINHSTAALPSQLHSYYKVSNANTLLSQHMVKFRRI